MEMGLMHLVPSGNLLCPSNRTADFEHEVADANSQTLICFPGGGHWQKRCDGQACCLCVFCGGDRIYLLWVGQHADNFCSASLYGLHRAIH